jgi:hypothetical protein
MASTMPLTSVLPSLVLVWPSNCGFGADGCVLQLLREVVVVRVGVDGARQRGAESGEVRSAFMRVDVVGERVLDGVVAVVPLQRNFGVYTVAIAVHVDGLLVDQALVLVQVFDKRDDAAVVVEAMVLRRLPLIVERNRDAGIQEGEFAESKICGSGLKVTLVPRRLVVPVTARSMSGLPRS